MTPARPHSWIAPAAAAIHFAAAVAMLLVLRPAADTGIPLADRVAWFESHTALWRAGWISWMAGAISLLAFYAWWGSALSSRLVARSALGVACLGACFDLTCEARLVAATRETLVAAVDAAGFWTTVFANGFYCVAGVILTLATPRQPRWLLAWSWAIWIAGFAMSAFGAVHWLPGIKATTAILTVLLCPWFLAMGRFLNSRSAA
ncbi:MAG: hypothetical protein K8T20_09370 [Planctomycetes bacterium]|nr:hypothetical protein [Planctomycetota bacterium]